MESRCNRSRDLMEAVQRGRQEEVVARLEQGEEVNKTFTMGRTALHSAAANSNIDTVSVLLEYGADPKICDTNGYSALHMACSRRGSDSMIIVDKLLLAGADIDLRNRHKRTPLHECVIVENQEAARKLLVAGADLDIKDRDGKTARELAFSRDSYEMAELLCGHPIGAAALSVISPRIEDSEHDEEEEEDEEEENGAALEVVKGMTVEEEKEGLKRRLAELEEGERRGLEARLRSKKSELDRVREDYRSRRELALTEIERLENHVKTLQAEETVKVTELDLEIARLGTELKSRARQENGVGSDLEELLLCPVCLDIAKPPVEVWQCPEGHIICGSCAERPELVVCPQCRVTLAGLLSRNRALEDLARRTFPREAETAARAATRGRERTRAPNAARTRASGRAGRGGGRRSRQVLSQVDQHIDFQYLRAPQQDPRSLLQAIPGIVGSSDEEGGYNLTSEVLPENIDDEFMPNFSTPDLVRTNPATRSSALVQRMNSIRLGTSPRHTHPTHRRNRRASPGPLPIANSRISRSQRGVLDEEDDEEDWDSISVSPMEDDFETGVRNAAVTGDGALPRASRNTDPAGRGRRGSRTRYHTELRQARNMR